MGHRMHGDSGRGIYKGINRGALSGTEDEACYSRRGTEKHRGGSS
jgi:hypothetical protein